ncbi:MAG: hypothetical protein AAGF46_11475, partial [Pseudomonadota bacterium]
NAGGIIDICYQHYGSDYGAMRQHVEATGTTLVEIFERSKTEGRPTAVVADELAAERFQRIEDSVASVV